MQETQETPAQSLHWENPLEKGLATHASIPAWEVLGERSLVDHKESGHDRAAEHQRMSPASQILDYYKSPPAQLMKN